MKKMKRGPFLSLILVMLLVLGGTGIYTISTQMGGMVSPDEAIRFANENSVSYYTTENATEGVVVSYYAPVNTGKMFSKIEVDETAAEFIYQELHPMGATFNLNNTIGIGFSKEQLAENTKNSTRGKEGKGPEELADELGSDNYFELINLYKVEEIDEVIGNDVVINQKTADLLGLGVGDTLKVAEDINLTIIKIVKRDESVNVYRHKQLYDERVDIPFLYYNETVRQKLVVLQEKLIEMELSKIEKEEQDTIGETLLTRSRMSEFRLTFSNIDDVESVLSYLERGLLNAEQRLANSEALESQRSDGEDDIYNRELQKILDKKINEHAEKSEYQPLAHNLSYAQYYDGVNTGVGDGKVCQQIEYNILSVKNDSKTDTITIPHTAFYLEVNGGSYSARDEGSFPLVLKPGEAKSIKVIFTYDVPAGRIPMGAPEEEGDKYVYNIETYYKDATTGEITEIMVPIKGGHMTSCLSTY